MESAVVKTGIEKSSRKSILGAAKRVVIKVGSGVLTAQDGLDVPIIEELASDICEIRKKGVEVILVSSGAIASGLRKIGLAKRPNSISQQQAVAAVGQCSLMMAYEEAFGRRGEKVAQILVTRDDLIHRRRYLNARNTLLTLLSWRIIPIINENDTVVVEEIKFGDNDNLSAMVTNLTESHLLLNLTGADGLYDKDPRFHPDARLIPVVERIDRRVIKYAGSVPGTLGTGGMASKIRAAHKVALRGRPTVIANGRKPHILKSLFAGEEEGTLFMPRSAPLCSRKHWIAFTKSPKGKLVVDKGAERALAENGKSLLPSGIKAVEGRFNVGDAVLLMNENGDEIGIGMVNYHSGDVKKILGAKSSEIESFLGFKHEDEVIHRDNLVMIARMEEGDDLCHLLS